MVCTKETYVCANEPYTYIYKHTALFSFFANEISKESCVVTKEPSIGIFQKTECVSSHFKLKGSFATTQVSFAMYFFFQY